MNQTIPMLSTSQSQDEAAICEVETGLAEAWNRHDAKAYAGFFTEDGDCVNVVGWWWKGRPQIEKTHTSKGSLCGAPGESNQIGPVLGKRIG